MVWYLAPGIDNTHLMIFINDFLERLNSDGTMARLREEHFGHTDGVSRISAHVFTQNMRQTLPLYRRLIRQVATEYQMDWHLLAAMAYQESRWDPNATSPTGVRGMMMLTKPTARELGVENRLDVTQSLRGGARYLKDLKRRLPKRLQEPDRTWMALAAYNIGLGHLEDARVLTERQGGNPRSVAGCDAEDYRFYKSPSTTKKHVTATLVERKPLLWYRTYAITTAFSSGKIFPTTNRHRHCIVKIISPKE